MIPNDLKEEAVRQARERGLSLGEFVREALRDSIERARARRARFGEDPLFADTAIFDGEVPLDGATSHDDHLYGPGEG